MCSQKEYLKCWPQYLCLAIGEKCEGMSNNNILQLQKLTRMYLGIIFTFCLISIYNGPCHMKCSRGWKFPGVF